MTTLATRSKRCEQRHHRECLDSMCGCTCHDEARERAAQERAASSRDYDHREDGHAYETPVVEVSHCGWCGVEVPQRAEGRRRRFCSPGCRVRAHRSTPKLF